MFGITDITTYIIGVVIIVLLPGPNSLFVLSVASRHGVAIGYRAACGVFVGDLILMVLTAVGMASLLRSLPGLFNLVKFAGAAYLAWLGVGMLRSAWADWRNDDASAPVEKPAQGTAQPFTRALAISLLNPKAILFFISFFIQFVDPGLCVSGCVFRDPGRGRADRQFSVSEYADPRGTSPGCRVSRAAPSGGRYHGRSRRLVSEFQCQAGNSHSRMS